MDVELIEMNSTLYLYVLHQGDFDKAVATISKQPISKLTIFEFKRIDEDNTDLVPVLTIEGLSPYSRQIIANPNEDFIYVTCGYGLYVIRPEMKRFSFIQTQQVAGLIEYVNKQHRQPMKNFEPVDEEMTVKNIVDCKEADIRFDGITRVIPF